MLPEAKPPMYSLPAGQKAVFLCVMVILRAAIGNLFKSVSHDVAFAAVLLERYGVGQEAETRIDVIG